MSVVHRLRLNNPARTRFSILLRGETSDANLAQALEQNPFVADIVLDLDGVQRTDWDSLLRVIGTRANLETMKVWDPMFAERRSTCNVPAALVRSILRAIQRNSSIQKVDLRYLRLPTNFLHLWTPCLHSHFSVSIVVTWNPPSGNEELAERKH